MSGIEVNAGNFVGFLITYTFFHSTKRDFKGKFRV